MIETSDNDGILTVTINRPEKANSLTGEMLEQLTQIALDAIDARAFIVTGKGKVFSAGADLEEAAAGLAVSTIWEDLSGAIAALPCLTIAALNGTLAGGATGMALACDLRLAVPLARFFYPVMKLGYLPQPSDPKRMSALIGPARTKLILMGGQKISAQDALAYGLIDRICEPDELLETAHDILTDSAAAKPELRAQIKRMCEG
jgi:enoyl-CoA hydratase